MGRFCQVNMAEFVDVIFQKAFHVLHLLQGLTVAAWAVEARGSH